MSDLHHDYRHGAGSWWFHFGMSLALAVILVMMPMGELIIAIPWLTVAVLAVASQKKNGFALPTLAIHALMMALVVSAAVAAPVKTTEKVLDRTFELPATMLTLGEMDTEQGFARTWLPRHVYIASPAEATDTAIHFPSRQLTLREFVAAIEQQSNLRHRFYHCGNGSSILYGGDCSFGLHLRPRPQN